MQREFFLCLIQSVAVASNVSVWTQHNDNARTGANLAEDQLNVKNVRPTSFGKVSEWPVDGQVYAQPLYLANVSLNARITRNIVYVATMKNKVYAFDADAKTPEMIWAPKTLGNPVPYNFMRMAGDPTQRLLSLGSESQVRPSSMLLAVASS